MEAAFRELVRTIWQIYLDRVADLVFLFKRVIVDPKKGCWIFIGHRNYAGYGRTRYRGKTCMAHSVAYWLLVGPTPPGKELDHDCEVKECCNPAHLTPRTRKEHNDRHGGVDRLLVKQRRMTHCKRGHEFTPENTALVNGRRVCRKCQSLRVMESRDRNRESFNAYRRDWQKRTQPWKRKKGSADEPPTLPFLDSDQPTR